MTQVNNITRIGPKMLRQTALAVGAISLLAVAVPSASAAPQSDRVVNKSRVTKVADNRGDRTNRTSPHRREFRRDNRTDRRDTRRNVRRDDSHNRRNYTPPRYSRSAHRGQRGYRTPYRSSLGISFHLGTPGYSQYRWAPTAYSFYRPAYGRYARYQSLTTCRRVILDGWYYGRRRPVSVKQCSNPWDGTYIVQGTERLVRHRRW